MTCEIITGDCLEVMRGMPDNSVDLIATDPPYGLDFRGAEWDSEIPEWFDLARPIASVVVFTTPPTTLWDYPRPDWVLNWFREAANSRTVHGGFCHWTPIPLYGDTKFPVDVFKSNASADGQLHKREAIGHPSPKPVKLMRWLIENTTKLGDLVLDPFAGSGSTGVACIETGRNFIGIEINPEYAAIARARCENAERQPDLFVMPAKAEQGSLL